MNRLILCLLIVLMSSFGRHKAMVVLPNGQKVTAKQYKRMQYQNNKRHYRFAKRHHHKKIIVIK